MPLPSPGSRQPYAADRKIRQLYQTTENYGSSEIELFPFFCIETRIDFNDVRTGFRETVSLSKALEIYSDTAELFWTDDMIREVDLAKTSVSVPDGVRLGVLPDFVDASFITRMENQFIQYLLRCFETRVYRNFDLNLYSFSGESQPEFFKRCVELFESPKRQELDELYEVFTRRLEQIRQKYIGLPDIGGLDQAKADSSNKDAFMNCSDRISRLFYSAEPVPDPSIAPSRRPSGVQELDEQLLSLEKEARQAFSNLCSRYEQKAQGIDEYILHPNLKDIHFVRSCILWIPRRNA